MSSQNEVTKNNQEELKKKSIYRERANQGTAAEPWPTAKEL